MIETYNNILRHLVNYQYELNNYISNTIRQVDNENNIIIHITILGIAFLYGFVHAAGPGHGKALVAFYFSSHQQNYKKAFELGYLISIIHAFSALITTFGIYFIFKIMFRQSFHNISNLSMIISSIMIIIVGVYLIWHSIKNHHKNDKINLKTSKKNKFMIAFSAGIVPCPGVMTIVLFCILLKHYLLGIFAAIFMSIGMGLTISIAGILSITLNKKLGKTLNRKSYLLEILGGILIICLGLFLLLSKLN